VILASTSTADRMPPHNISNNMRGSHSRGDSFLAGTAAAHDEQ
jgi:hypothetical protein